MKTVNGWAFPDADEFMVGQMKADGTYQATHLQRALAHVTDFSCAVDGGAHVGTWSKLLALRFQKVLAFEPSPDTYEALVANMAAFACANVEARNEALGAVPGFIEMILDGRGADLKNTGARYVRDVPHGRRRTSIRRLVLDELHLPTLGFLKMDVEGSEPMILMGARLTLARCKPIVLFENKGLCRRYGLKPTACQDFLTKQGYRELEAVGCDRIWGPA